MFKILCNSSYSSSVLNSFGESLNSVNSVGMVLDFSHFNDEIFKKINAKLIDSFNKIDGYDDAIDEIIRRQTTESKDQIGFIVSNFAYLLRAFDKDMVFFAYVSSVLKQVQTSMGLEY